MCCCFFQHNINNNSEYFKNILDIVLCGIHELTQAMSSVLQLFWHSEPVDPGAALEQLKKIVGESQAERQLRRRLSVKQALIFPLSGAVD